MPPRLEKDMAPRKRTDKVKSLFEERSIYVAEFNAIMKLMSHLYRPYLPEYLGMI